jgi:hypothetical protein
MPPIRSQSPRNRTEQEGRILLAIQAIKNKEISSVAHAARTFEVPRLTLRDRVSGCIERATIRANSHKLTEIEEETLQKWIISMDLRGAAPRPSTIREIADLLLAARGSTSPLSVGDN